MEGNGVDGQYVVVSPIGPGGSPSGVAYVETEWVKKTEWSSYYRDSHNNYESEEGGDHTETFNPNTGAIDTQSGSHSQWSQGGGSGSGSGSGSATGSSSSSSWGSAGTIGVGAGFAVAAATPAPAPTPTLGGGAAALQSQGLTGAANLVAGAGTTTAQGAGSSTFVWNESSGSLPNGGRWEYYDDGVNWWYYEYDDQNNMTLEKSGTYTSTMQAAFFRGAAEYFAANPEEYEKVRRLGIELTYPNLSGQDIHQIDQRKQKLLEYKRFLSSENPLERKYARLLAKSLGLTRNQMLIGIDAKLAEIDEFLNNPEAVYYAELKFREKAQQQIQDAMAKFDPSRIPKERLDEMIADGLAFRQTRDGRSIVIIPVTNEEGKTSFVVLEEYDKDLYREEFDFHSGTTLQVYDRTETYYGIVGQFPDASYL